MGDSATEKIADLVLLDADPLADIGNTRKIAAVILGGKFLSAGRSRSDAQQRHAPPPTR